MGCRYQVEFIRDDGDVNDIIAMDAEGFGDNTISPEIVRTAYGINRFSVAVARDSSGHILGYIDYYGLRETTMNSLIAGEFLESELSRDDILPIDEVVKSRKVYIGGMMIRRRSGAGRGRIVASLLRFGLSAVEDLILSEAPHVDVYVSAYGCKAVGILNRMGFAGVSDAGQRRDNSNLYVKRLTKDVIRAEIGALTFEAGGEALRNSSGEPGNLHASRALRGAFSPSAPSI